MAVKLLVLFVVAAALALTQGQAVNEILLPDVETTFITNPLIGKTLTIQKSFLDTLVRCLVVFPNGVPYEAYPNNNIPPGPITFLNAVEPFTSCGISFLNAPVSASGTYELMATVRPAAAYSLTLTRQRFHLRLVASDLWKGDVPAVVGAEE